MDPYLLNVIVGGLIVGLAAGAIPLFWSAFRRRLPVGLVAFPVCGLAGVLLGAIGALPTAAAFVAYIEAGR